MASTAIWMGFWSVMMWIWTNEQNVSGCWFGHWILNCIESTYDLEGVGDDADGHQLLSVVAAVHHERVGETLDDGALCLPESLLGVSAGGVGDVDGGTDLDVIAGEC